MTLNAIESLDIFQAEIKELVLKAENELAALNTIFENDQKLIIKSFNKTEEQFKQMLEESKDKLEAFKEQLVTLGGYTIIKGSVEEYIDMRYATDADPPSNQIAKLAVSVSVLKDPTEKDKVKNVNKKGTKSIGINTLLNANKQGMLSDAELVTSLDKVFEVTSKQGDMIDFEKNTYLRTECCWVLFKKTSETVKVQHYVNLFEFVDDIAILKDMGVAYIEEQEKTLKATYKSFFGKEYDEDGQFNLINIAGGLLEGSVINNISITANKTNIYISILSDRGYFNRYIYKDQESNELYLSNVKMMINNKGSYEGTATFNHQIQACEKNKIAYIKAHASKSATRTIDNGYYTLAVWGFEMYRDIDIETFNQLMQVNERKESSLQELISTPEGRDWWKINGFAYSGIFNLTGAKSNLSNFNKYLTKEIILKKNI